MELDRLGPLEQAILRALLNAEALGIAHPIPSIWCCLPRYRTRLANVQQALAGGSPLRRYLAEAHGHYALRDREDLLGSLAARKRSGDELWSGVEGAVRGLARLPYVEGVALAGSMAWGVPAASDPTVDLVVLAEGGRSPHASRVAEIYLRRRPAARPLRVVELIDADQLAQDDAGEGRALALLTLRPVVSQAGFEALWHACPWLQEHFPNFQADSHALAGLLDPYLGERQDGALARLRRRAARAPSIDEEPMLTTARRRAGLLSQVEDTFRSRIVPNPVLGSQASLPGFADGSLAVRWSEIGAWEWPEAQPQVAAPPLPAAAQEERGAPAEERLATAAEAVPAAAPEAVPQAADDSSSPVPGPVRAAASAETGQRFLGAGRRKPRSRSRRVARGARGRRKAN